MRAKLNWWWPSVPIIWRNVVYQRTSSWVELRSNRLCVSGTWGLTVTFTWAWSSTLMLFAGSVITVWDVYDYSGPTPRSMSAYLSHCAGCFKLRLLQRSAAGPTRISLKTSPEDAQHSSPLVVLTPVSSHILEQLHSLPFRQPIVFKVLVPFIKHSMSRHRSTYHICHIHEYATHVLKNKLIKLYCYFQHALHVQLECSLALYNIQLNMANKYIIYSVHNVLFKVIKIRNFDLINK